MFTDEEIVKALECMAGKVQRDCDKCAFMIDKFCSDTELATATLDLIRRLQENNANQVRMRCDMQRKFDDLQTLCTKQKAEIERLTEEKDKYQTKWHTAYMNELDLQKQVDELKKRLHWIWAIGVDYDGCDKAESLKELINEMVELTQMESKDLDEYFTYNTTQGGKMNILNIIRKQAVKEICDEIIRKLETDWTDAVKTVKETAKQFGVEVQNG